MANSKPKARVCLKLHLLSQKPMLCSHLHCSPSITAVRKCLYLCSAGPKSAKSKDQTERDLGRHSPFAQVPKLAEDSELFITEVPSCNIGECFLLDGSGAPPPHSSCCRTQNFPTTVEGTSLPSAVQNCMCNCMNIQTLVLCLIRVFQSTMPLCNSRGELYAPMSHWTQAALYRSMVLNSFLPNSKQTRQGM